MTQVPSTIYTFYSYKGGVGRSMALVNVGALLALQGKRVLLVDWDLEAPGLEFYFKGCPNAKLIGDPVSVPGIVDLLEARVKGRELSWESCRLRADFFGRSLDIITAGKKDEAYRSRVERLNWERLYEEPYRIGDFIEELRDEWRSPGKGYDFILVDSRTGITDIGDICTVLLPDAVVLMFVTNYQNIDGIKSVMARAEKARKSLPVNRAKLHGVPLPARDETYSEREKSANWKKIFAQNFGNLFREWLPKDLTPEDALSKLFIPYVTYWSFGERIPVIESPEDIKNPTSISAAYQRVANLLGGGLDWSRLEEHVPVVEIQFASHAIRLKRLYAGAAAAAVVLVIAALAFAFMQRTPMLDANKLTADVASDNVSIRLLATDLWARQAQQQTEARNLIATTLAHSENFDLRLGAIIALNKSGVTIPNDTEDGKEANCTLTKAADPSGDTFNVQAQAYVRTHGIKCVN